MSARHDTADRSPPAGYSPRDDDRYGLVDLGDDGTIIYDEQREAAWIQSSAATQLAVRR